MERKKPHPYSDLMAAYARIAKETDTPWLSFEWKYKDSNQWQICNKPCSFKLELDYRLIGAAEHD